MATASAQVDPLAPLPEQQRPPAPTPTPAPVTAYRQPYAQPATATSFESYKLRLAYLASAAGVRQATIANVVPYLQLNNRAIRLDRGQPGGVGNPNYTPPFEPLRLPGPLCRASRRGRLCPAAGDRRDGRHRGAARAGVDRGMISLTPLQPFAPAEAFRGAEADFAVSSVRTILRCTWDRPKTDRNLTSLTKR